MQLCIIHHQDEVEFPHFLGPLLSNLEFQVYLFSSMSGRERISKLFDPDIDTQRVILFCLSERFLRVDSLRLLVEEAQDCHLSNERLRVFAVVLSPCDVKAFGSIRFLFRKDIPLLENYDGYPIYIGAFDQIKEDLCKTVRDLRSSVDLHSRKLISEPIPCHEMFPMSGKVSRSYIKPDLFTELEAYLKIKGRGLVVEGAARVGKTTLLHHALNGVAFRELCILQDRGEIGRLLADFERAGESVCTHLIFDRFHEASPVLVKRIAMMINRMAERNMDGKVILVGRGRFSEGLFRAQPSLFGRLDVLELSGQSDDCVWKMMSRAEETSNFCFLHKSAFVDAACGSLMVAQMLCYHAVVREGHNSTPENLENIFTFPAMLKGLKNTMESRFLSIVKELVSFDYKYDYPGTVYAALWLLAAKRRVRIDFDEIEKLHPYLDVLRLRSELPEWLDGADGQSFGRMIHCDFEKMTLLDPALLFFLVNLQWASFAKSIGYDAVFNILGELTSVSTYSRRSFVLFIDLPVYPHDLEDARLLHTYLSSAYSNQSAFTHLLARIGVGRENIPLLETVSQTWHEVLNMLARERKLRELLNAVLKDTKAKAWHPDFRKLLSLSEEEFLAERAR